jgi:ribosomal protein L12E/L44/L45/RPP1/RPP2
LFHTKLQEILAEGEPVEDPAAVAAAWADYAETEKESKKKKREDSERDKFRRDYEKRGGK